MAYMSVGTGIGYIPWWMKHIESGQSMYTGRPGVVLITKDISFKLKLYTLLLQWCAALPLRWREREGGREREGWCVLRGCPVFSFLLKKADLRTIARQQQQRRVGITDRCCSLPLTSRQLVWGPFRSASRGQALRQMCDRRTAHTSNS